MRDITAVRRPRDLDNVMSDDAGAGNAQARIELANRLFFRLYQCANLLHKTGTRAVQEEGLTTQQWAVMGALSRPRARDGMGMGELTRYLMVTRQNLSAVLKRMEAAGHIQVVPGKLDRRARLITMTESGRQVWTRQALPKIHAYYQQALSEFSVSDLTHSLHYMMKLLKNMEKLDAPEPD